MGFNWSTESGTCGPGTRHQNKQSGDRVSGRCGTVLGCEVTQLNTAGHSCCWVTIGDRDIVTSMDD